MKKFLVSAIIFSLAGFYTFGVPTSSAQTSIDFNNCLAEANNLEKELLQLSQTSYLSPLDTIKIEREIKFQVNSLKAVCLGDIDTALDLCLTEANLQQQEMIENNPSPEAFDAQFSIIKETEAAKQACYQDADDLAKELAEIMPIIYTKRLEDPIKLFNSNLQERTTSVTKISNSNLQQALEQYTEQTETIFEYLFRTPEKDQKIQLQSLEEQTITDFHILLNKFPTKSQEIQLTFQTFQLAFELNHALLGTKSISSTYCENELKLPYSYEVGFCLDEDNNGVYILTNTQILDLSAHLNVPFSDSGLTLHHYYPAILTLTEQGIISGYPDGTFKPDNFINRAEFTKIIIGTRTSSPQGASCFSDVTSEWFAPYICQAKTDYIITGHPDGTFKPANNINVAEALKIVTEGLLNATPTPSETATEWFDQYIDFAKLNNYFLPTWITPDQPITRAEMAELIVRIQQLKN